MMDRLNKFVDNVELAARAQIKDLKSVSSWVFLIKGEELMPIDFSWTSDLERDIKFSLLFSLSAKVQPDAAVFVAECWYVVKSGNDFKGIEEERPSKSEGKMEAIRIDLYTKDYTRVSLIPIERDKNGDPILFDRQDSEFEPSALVRTEIRERIFPTEKKEEKIPVKGRKFPAKDGKKLH